MDSHPAMFVGLVVYTGPTGVPSSSFTWNEQCNTPEHRLPQNNPRASYPVCRRQPFADKVWPLTKEPTQVEGATIRINTVVSLVLQELT